MIFSDIYYKCINDFRNVISHQWHESQKRSCSFVRCVIFSNGHADWLSIEFNEILLFYLNSPIALVVNNNHTKYREQNIKLVFFQDLSLTCSLLSNTSKDQANNIASELL